MVPRTGSSMVEAGDIITLAAGAWRLRAPLGGSSYGLLWRADSVLTGAPAAIKLVNRAQMARALPPQRAHWRACFDAEIGFLRTLQPWDGRHIVRLLDSGEHDGLPAMALELLDGDLAAHLAALRSRGGAPGVHQALAWIAQVNAALAKVHQYGWRYLDLKPANLLVDARSGAVKLADFGTNRPLLDAAAHSYAGTAAWQAPEQFFPAADGRYRTDARSDYFALGALLYTLVGGIPLRYCAACAGAFREHGTAPAAATALRTAHGGAMPAVLAPDEAALFLRHAGAWPASLDAEGGSALLALLRALLAPRPEDRPRHALEISRLIARAQAALGATTGTNIAPLRSAA
jgi:serine/threonine protein kinase